MCPVAFAGDALLQELFQLKPPSLPRTSAYDLGLSEVRPKRQEASEFLVAVAGRSLLARGRLPIIVAAQACLLSCQGGTNRLASRCNPANCEGVRGD